MDGVHGCMTSGASRLHYVAGVTQIAPGGPTNEWQGRRAQQPREGLLASKGVQFPRGTNLATVSTPVTMTGPAGFGIWGVGRREASRETREHGGNFRPRTKTHFPRPRASTYREIRLLGLKEHLGIPSQNCSPPLAESPFCYILSEDLDPSRKNGRSHTSLLLTGVRGGVSTFDIPKKRNRYIHG